MTHDKCPKSQDVALVHLSLGIDVGTNNTFPYNHAPVYAFSRTGL